MLEPLLAKIRSVIGDISPSPETLARRETLALQDACCALLMEVARLDSAGIEPKREAAAQAMRELFAVTDAELAAMIADTGRPETRLTSYFRPVALINRRFAPEQKVRFIERLWRIAAADGGIDMYEDQLVRKLADLLYVEHADFILAKRRVQGGSRAKGGS
jgi:uncharacterized tellurite resistance protein B-like protein